MTNPNVQITNKFQTPMNGIPNVWEVGLWNLVII
jgi:hypothetical protein